MCDREDACLSWLLFLFFAKWTWKHFIILIWWPCTHERPWTVHTQFAKHGRILLLLNLQVLSKELPKLCLQTSLVVESANLAVFLLIGAGSHNLMIVCLSQRLANFIIYCQSRQNTSLPIWMSCWNSRNLIKLLNQQKSEC